MKHLLHCLGLLLLVLPHETQSQALDGTSRGESTDQVPRIVHVYGFAVELPAGWKKLADAEAGIQIWILNRGQPDVEMQTFKLPSSTQKAQQWYLDFAREDFADVIKIVQSGEFSTKSGLRGLQVQSELFSNLHHDVYLPHPSGGCQIFEFRCPTKDIDRFAPVFKKLLQGIRYDDADR